MTYHVQKGSESDSKIQIQYNCGQRSVCDGMLCYDKQSGELSVLLLSSGASILETEQVFPALKDLLTGNRLTEQRQKITVS